MTTTLSNLWTIQLERLMALPEKAQDNPIRTALLDTIQRRNASLDAVFYDIAQVRESELRPLAFWLAREGALLLVPPSNEADLQVFLAKEDFLAAGGGAAKALVVAGVGSSAVGAAAFARNVADAVGGPVAAVVSGYGLSDVLTEALGGYFWFGGLNSLRHGFEELDRATKTLTKSEPEITASTPEDMVRLSRDTATLIDLLGDPRFEAPLLVGHSKGNLVISEALYALEKKDALEPLAARCQIVTISAKVGMPEAFIGKVFDIIGQWDGFGALNSRPDIPADYIVPGAWHSTNPAFPFGMGIDVTATLLRILPLLGEQKTPPGRIAPASLWFDLPQRLAGAWASAAAGR